MSTADTKRRPTAKKAADTREGAGPPFAGALKSFIRAPVELAKAMNPNREQSDLARVAFYGTLAGLVLTEIIEPPLALIVGVAHALSTSRSPAARAIGEGVQDAGA